MNVVNILRRLRDYVGRMASNWWWSAEDICFWLFDLKKINFEILGIN